MDKVEQYTEELYGYGVGRRKEEAGKKECLELEEGTNKMKDRIEWVDLASGTMILWLLFFHALYPSIGANITGEIPFLYFFMPWFFFKSGMFFKIKESKLEFKGNFKKLMLDGFIKWSIIGYVAYILEHWLIYDDLTARLAFYSPARSLLLGGCIPLNVALWFLPVLFVIRQSFNYIKQKFAPPFGYFS